MGADQCLDQSAEGSHVHVHGSGQGAAAGQLTSARAGRKSTGSFILRRCAVEEQGRASLEDEYAQHGAAAWDGRCIRRETIKATALINRGVLCVMPRGRGWPWPPFGWVSEGCRLMRRLWAHQRWPSAAACTTAAVLGACLSPGRAAFAGSRLRVRTALPRWKAALNRHRLRLPRWQHSHKGIACSCLTGGCATSRACLRVPWRRRRCRPARWPRRRPPPAAPR